MDTSKMEIDLTVRRWLLAVAGGSEITILRPEVGDSTSPMLAATVDQGGEMLAIECVIDDDNGSVLFDLGLDYIEFEAGQGGEGAERTDLDQRSTHVTLRTSSAAEKAAAEDAKRRAFRCSHCQHEIRDNHLLETHNGPFYCPECATELSAEVSAWRTSRLQMPFPISFGG